MRRALLCAALAILLGPSGSGAQSLTLTESEALARLSAGGARERALRAGVDIARADVLSAQRWPNPRLTVNREAVAGVTEYITTISQPLPITGRRSLEVQAASALASATSSRADDGVRRLRADLRLAFAELLVAQARERELTNARDRLRGLVAVLAAREAAGDTAGFDRLRAAREVLDLETDLALAATDRTRAQAVLAAFFADGIDAARIVAVPGPPGVGEAPMPSLDALLARAETTRGELVALRHDVEAAGFAARAADRRWVPEPEIVGGTKSATFPAVDVGSVIGVNATVPLFDRGRPERALAVARASQADAHAASFRQVLRGQVAALREGVIQRRAAAARYRAEAVGGAADIERIAQVSYEAGERGILELLDAYRLGASARVRQAMLDAAARESAIELEFATGWEMPE